MRLKIRRILNLVIIVYFGLLLTLLFWNGQYLQRKSNGFINNGILKDSLLWKSFENRDFTPRDGISGISKKSIIRQTNVNTTCILLRNNLREEKWQNVDNVHKMYVFSAFVNGQKITGIAVIQLRSKIKLFCKLWYGKRGNCDSDAKHIVVPAKIANIQEHHSKKYTSAFYTCELPRNIKEYPYALSLVTDRTQKPENAVPVRHNTEGKYQFTVCITPLNYQYSKAYELVEMIELNLILGASRFVFYNHTTRWNVDKVLEYYQNKGIVEVVQWHLPMKVDTWPKTHEPEIHYFAQLGALNDCLYRNRFQSKYLVYQDLDEFIIPRKHKNWGDMMDKLPKNQASYLFRNAFFRKEWPDTDMNYSGNDVAKRFKSVTLLKLKREDKIYSKTHRSKYIINPKFVDMVGIHNIWRYNSGKVHNYVDPEIALLHHYRNWENPKDPVKRKEDTRMLVFKDDLIHRLQNTWGSLSNVPLGPL